MPTPVGYKKIMVKQTATLVMGEPVDKVGTHLNRIRGQVEGVAKMYAEERDCLEIVQQIMAVRSSLGRVARELLSGEASRCSRERRLDDLEVIFKEVFR